MKTDYCRGCSIGQWVRVRGEGIGILLELHPENGTAIVEIRTDLRGRVRMTVGIGRIAPVQI